MSMCDLLHLTILKYPSGSYKAIYVCLFVTLTFALGKLKLKIPYKNLYTEPVVAELEGLYVLAVPRTGS